MILELLNTRNRVLGQPNHINIALGVLSEDQLGSLVQQVVEFSAVDFIEGEICRKVAVLGLFLL